LLDQVRCLLDFFFLELAGRSFGWMEEDGQDLGRVSGETSKLLKTRGSQFGKKNAAETQSNASMGISDAFKAERCQEGGI
jgi:hypothetical protein